MYHRKYLRFSDLKAVGTADQHIVYFRGAADVARKEQVQMHNRWDLEFDTEMIPGYDTLMDFSGKRLAEGCQWSERMRLRDTWEDVLLLCVPVMDNSGKVRGICGVELSGLHFTLTYPAAVVMPFKTVCLSHPSKPEGDTGRRGAWGTSFWNFGN